MAAVEIPLAWGHNISMEHYEYIPYELLSVPEACWCMSRFQCVQQCFIGVYS